MQVIENAIVINRPAEQVFDVVSDMRTEARWNPVVTMVTLRSPEPVGVGSRFESRVKGAGTSWFEVAVFDRPVTWTAVSTKGALPVRLTGRVVALGADASRLTMRIELMPTGLMTVLAPALKLMLQPTAKANLTRIKALVET